MSTVRTLRHPARKDINLPGVLYALSDPIRLDIVKKLAANGAQACGSLNLPISKSTATHHFRVLREAGLISMEPAGARYLNSLRQGDLDARFPGLLDAILTAQKK